MRVEVLHEPAEFIGRVGDDSLVQRPAAMSRVARVRRATGSEHAARHGRAERRGEQHETTAPASTPCVSSSISRSISRCREASGTMSTASRPRHGTGAAATR